MDENINYADASAADKSVIQEIEAKLSPVAGTPKKLGVALVGLGSYASGQLGPALLETEHCYLAGIVTGSASKIQEWKMKYTIPDENIYDYGNFDEIKNNRNIDIVYIVLPNALHAEFVKRAAAAGKHVICEKPMAISTSECDEMMEACRRARVLLSIGYRLHFDPYHAEIMKLGQGKVFGEVKNIHAQHGSSDTHGWRLNKRLAGGGPLMDLGIYCIQAACYSSGLAPIAVTVKEHSMRDEIEVSLSWEMEFPGGVKANCETSYVKDMNLLHVYADHGWMELSPAFSYTGLTGKTASGFINQAPVNQQAKQMDSFAISIMEASKVHVPGEMGRRDLAIIEAIYQSMKTGKRVEITNPDRNNSSG